MRYRIGIDPGGNTLGFAIWDREKRELSGLRQTTFWDAIGMITAFYQEHQDDMAVHIEDPNKNKPVFHRPGESPREKLKRAQDVGRNKQTATYLLEYCKRQGIKAYGHRPGAGSLTKLNADEFNRITRYQGRSNQHSRDAAMLVFDR